MAIEVTTAPTETSIADGDELYFNDVSETPDAINKITFANMIGTALAALRSVFTAASSSGPASLALHEDTDNGTNKITVTAPASIASDKTFTLPDVTGTAVVGALGSTDNAILRADGTGGSAAQGSGPTIDDSGNLLNIAAISGHPSTGNLSLWIGNGVLSEEEIRLDNGTGNVIFNGGRQITIGATLNVPDVGIKRDTGGVIRFTDASTGGGTTSSPATSPSQITSNQNNYNPGGRSYFQRWNTDASRNITGLVFASTSADGERHLIVNVGSQNIVLQNENASSTAANRFTNSTGADITLSANQAAEIIYDSTTTRWRVYKRN
jgi:hypothetical protein